MARYAMVRRTLNQLYADAIFGKKAMESRTPSEVSGLQRLRNTKTWSILEILVPILSLAIPIILFLYSERGGQITVRGLQRSALIGRRDGIQKDVKVFYREAQVANITRYILEIENTGRRDIDGSDVRYLRWTPPVSSQILEAAILQKTVGYGDFLAIDYTNPRSLNFRILTLNRGVRARVSILCSSTSPTEEITTSKVEGVIKGARLIDESRNFASDRTRSFVASLFVGDIWSNIVRLLVFSGIAVGLTIMVAFPITKFRDWRFQKSIDSALEKINLWSTHDPNEEARLLVEYAHVDRFHAESIAKSIKFFSGLNQEQFSLCRKLLQVGNEQTDAKALIEATELLQPHEKQILMSIPDLDTFIYSIQRFRTFYHPSAIMDNLVRQGRFQ